MSYLSDRTARLIGTAVIGVLTLSGSVACSAPDQITVTRAASMSRHAEPRVLYEWFPAGSTEKTISTTDAVFKADGVAVTPDTGQGVNVHASWAPDGKRFTWEVLDLDKGRSSVWIANADGSRPKQVITCKTRACTEMSFPTWSPDGRSILVVQFDGGPEIWGPSHLVDVDLATGRQRVLASTKDGSTAFYLPAWAPDGKHVAAQLETYKDATESSLTSCEIVVVDANPATRDRPRSITKPTLFAGRPSWNPRTSRILFASYEFSDYFNGDQPSQLFEADSDGHHLRQITHMKGDRPGNASWTPDGKRIIASIAIVAGGSVTDQKLAYIDPNTGRVDRSDRSGASPRLQPMSGSR